MVPLCLSPILERICFGLIWNAVFFLRKREVFTLEGITEELFI